MKVFQLFVFVGVLLVVQPAYATRFSVDYLMRVCSMDKEGREVVKGGHTACQAYISGVIDYHAMLRSLNIAPSVNFCIPDGITITYLHREVVQYFQKNKHEQGPFVATSGVALALYKAFPCMKKLKN